MRQPSWRTFLLALLLLSTGCAQVSSLLGRSNEPDLVALWGDAQDALSAEDFELAELLFADLATNHRETLEGREALFYLGVIRIDTRNPEFNSRLAEDRFGDYLEYMVEGGPRLYRYPEALTLHGIARQFNLPAESRIQPLRPEERVVVVEEPLVPPAERARELSAEIERLRQQLAERDARIRQQQEELDRIRRTLTGPTPGQP